MRKIALLLLVACYAMADDNLYKPLQIGPKNRNQIVRKGFEIGDTVIFDGVTIFDVIKFPSNLKTDSSGTVYGDTSGAIFTCDDVYNCIDTSAVVATQSYVNNGFWNINGNSGTNSATNFIGTTDSKDFTIKTNGIERSKFGANGQWITQSSFSPNDTFLVSVTDNALGFGLGAARLQHATLDGQSGAVALDGSGFGKTRNYSVYGFTDFAAKNSFLETGYDSTSRLAWLQLQVQNNVNRYTVRLATDTGLVVNCPLYYTDGTQGGGKVLTSDANGLGSWQPVTGTTVLDSISETGDTISLSVNTTHVITSESVILDATLIFPTGVTGHWIDIVFSKSIVTLTNSGVGADLVSLLEPTFGTSKRYVNIGGNWY